MSVKDYLPEVFVELKYATVDNFTGQKIYTFQNAYLRYGTVKKLEAVCQILAAQGLYIKIWDAFRPTAAQFRLWDVCPDPNFVADPTSGFSSHSRGNTIDLTLVDADGRDLEMPSEFDDFSLLADRDYSDCTEAAAHNAALLQTLMEENGFRPYFKEWWHFSDTVEYPVSDFAPCETSRWYADCREFISLRSGAAFTDSVMTCIPAGAAFTLLGWDGDFALVRFQNQQGYVHGGYIQPERDSVELWEANCEEYISLRTAPGGSRVIARIPAGETFTLKQLEGKYALVRYGSLDGYVLTSYIRPVNNDMPEIVKAASVYTYEQMNEDLALLAAEYPELAKVISIGISEEGRDIPALQIGDPEAGHHILLQGAIHGREHMTAWLLIALAENYLANGPKYGAGICFHIIPMANPDGVVIAQGGILNAAGTAIYESDKALNHTSCDAAHYAEMWKANALGVDINRNFSSGWDAVRSRSGPSSQQYKGSEPFSSAEARALRDYTMRYPFGATLSFHAHGSVLYYEYGDREPVNTLSHSLALAMEKSTGYIPTDSEGLDGAGYKDWCMDAMGIPSLTVEVGCSEAPLAERELYCIFERCRDILPIAAEWLMRNSQT